MGSDSGEPRQSSDSTNSQTPFIQNQSLPFRPPSRYSEGNAGSVHNASTQVNLSTIVIAVRVLAAISGLGIGIAFVLLPPHYDMDITIALAVFVWFSLVWDIIVLITLVRGPSLRISLVMHDGRAINFLSRDDDEGSSRRCGLPRAFWIDLTLVVVVFSLTIVNHVHGWWIYQITTGLGWIVIFFHIVIVLLTASPKMASAHVRFERTDRAQIVLA
ncbi:hypothetical protein RRF57_001723 [Xylaria bambusicola]|uniref:Uncharacterized protein n=1 Tax=Xylaria bambusicola TaxID=326684 RepID=A0AAN7UE85_9PEZI